MKPETAVQMVDVYGSVRAAARCNVGRHTYHSILKAYNKAVEMGLAPSRTGVKDPAGKPEGKIAVPPDTGSNRGNRTLDGDFKPKQAKQVAIAGGRTFIFTCAQNNTKVHPQFWANLLAFKDHLGAELHVARITYNKSAYKAQPVKSKDKPLYAPREEMWFDPAVQPYLSDSRLAIGKGLIWCGDMDILPTAVRPLSGLETYTGRKSGIFPHVKIALESIPGAKSENTKLNMTTGTVTLRNYIQRKTGMKAEFHHCFGALLVEVDEKGHWWPRQLNADSEGTFYDLDRKVENGKVTSGHRLEAIYWADPQIVEHDPDLIALAFGPGGMKDVLKPKMDFMGDVGSFKSRSHWDQKDPYHKFMRFTEGLGDVAKEAVEIQKFLQQATRSWCKTHVLDGNHERHIGRWLRETNGLMDPVNAELWTSMNTHVLRYIRHKHCEPHYLDVLLRCSGWRAPVTYVGRDESVIVCPDAGGGIECGEHGDDGTHGGRGSTATHRKAGRKKCLGHAWAEISDQIYRASSFSRRGLDWMHGNTAMNTCASVLIYQNGKRTLNFMFAGKWRA